MEKISFLQLSKRYCSLGALCLFSLSFSWVSYAEPAPVYDVDSMPQQQQQAQPPIMETENNQPMEELPPMPPGDEENTFVPMQQNANKDPVQPAPQEPVQEAPVVAQTSNLPIDQRIKRIEQQMNNIQSPESIAKVESLQNQVQTLRGQIEQLNHQLQQVQTQQKAMYSDIDKRLGQQLAQANTGNKALPVVEPLAAANTEATTNAVKSILKPATPGPTKTSPAKTVTAPAGPSNQEPNHQPNVAEEQQIYQTAYTLIKGKKYGEAVNTLQNMLHKYPSGQFASNAHYWLGELYGVMGKNDQALTEFGTVVNTYPDSPRVSDAQLKVGLIYAAQFKWSDAKIAFKKVINHYPGTTSSRLASEQLKQIKQAGH